MYVKSCHNFEVIHNLTKSIDNVSESLFIELKRGGNKNIIIGCIYRHHSPISTFINDFLNNALVYVTKYSSKISAIMGDFNIDLVNYANDRNTGTFYDLCIYNFRPLILQPTRVTSRTATLIDNIFINDISCHSLGGNITVSISDHFFQFCHTDIFGGAKYKEMVKYARNENFKRNYLT